MLWEGNVARDGVCPEKIWSWDEVIQRRKRAQKWRCTWNEGCPRRYFFENGVCHKINLFGGCMSWGKSVPPYVNIVSG